MRSPIHWLGGKGNMVAKIIPLLERIPHRQYVEPFGGGASILLAKKPKPIETYNDLDSALYDFFMVLADPELFKQFYRRVEALPYSRKLYNECRETWREEPDLVLRVAKWFVVARQSFGGHFAHSWGYVVAISRSNMVQTTSAWLSTLKILPEVHRRLQRVQIENQDFRVLMKAHAHKNCLMYCDPPYLHELRRDGEYAQEMSEIDHTELVESLLTLPGKFALSCYFSELYQPLIDAGWVRIDWETGCSVAARTKVTGLQGEGSVLAMQPRTETILLSPSCGHPQQLKLL